MRAFGHTPSRPMPLAGPGTSFGEFKVDPAVAAALIEAGSAVATTAIAASGKSSKRPKKRKGSTASTSVEAPTPPAESSAPSTVPWGPIALGSAAVLALAVVFRRPAPVAPARLANPCQCRKRRRGGRHGR